MHTLGGKSMWSWKQTIVHFSQSSCTGTEYEHWLNSRKVQKNTGNETKKKISDKSQMESHVIPGVQFNFAPPTFQKNIQHYAFSQ